MIKLICLLIIMSWPLVTAVHGIAKEKSNTDEHDKIIGNVASVIVLIITYALYYFAGLFDLLISL